MPAVAYTYSRGGKWNKITRRLDGTCTRGIYQGMKDGRKRAARGEK
jgi:hypothetical protein